MYDRDGDEIQNTAGTPIPNVQADWAFASLSLTKSYLTAAAAATDLVRYANTVNSSEWAGFGRRCWKCQGGSWQKQTQSSGGVNLTYYSATFNFDFDKRQWVNVQVMIGTRDSDGNNITESMVGGSGEGLVSEPVGLDWDGKPVTPPAKPAKKTFFVYEEKDFSYFGTPS
jgi:hypothetical protein